MFWVWMRGTRGAQISLGMARDVLLLLVECTDHTQPRKPYDLMHPKTL